MEKRDVLQYEKKIKSSSWKHSITNIQNRGKVGELRRRKKELWSERPSFFHFSVRSAVAKSLNRKGIQTITTNMNMERFNKPIWTSSQVTNFSWKQNGKWPSENSQNSLMVIFWRGVGSTVRPTIGYDQSLIYLREKLHANDSAQDASYFEVRLFTPNSGRLSNVSKII